MQTAVSTSTITITATPASRPESKGDPAPQSTDGLVPGSVDELVAPGSVDDDLTPEDELVSPG